MKRAMAWIDGPYVTLDMLPRRAVQHEPVRLA